MLRAVAVAAILSSVAHAETFDGRWPTAFTERWPPRAPAAVSSVRKEHPAPVIAHKQSPVTSARPRDGVDDAHRFEAAAWLGWGQPVETPEPGVVAVWRNEAATVVRVMGQRLVVASVSRSGASYVHERSAEGILGYRAASTPAPVPALVRILRGQ